MRARPQDEVAVMVLAPAASEPMQALMALCSLSTGMNSVSTCPFATKAGEILRNLRGRSDRVGRHNVRIDLTHGGGYRFISG